MSAEPVSPGSVLRFVMEQYGRFLDLARDAWATTAQKASQRPDWGREKERELANILRDNLATLCPECEPSMTLSDPYSPEMFLSQDGRHCSVDLVAEYASARFAIEIKFKRKGDGAVPDNRIEAFYDLWKCEAYVDSGEYDAALFVLLTDEPSYMREASGKSREFSLHEGRIYQRNTPLCASRSRRGISLPNPLTLKRDYSYRWVSVIHDWHTLSFLVAGQGSTSLL